MTDVSISTCAQYFGDRWHELSHADKAELVKRCREAGMDGNWETVHAHLLRDRGALSFVDTGQRCPMIGCSGRPHDGHGYACCGKVGRISRHESWCPTNTPGPTTDTVVAPADLDAIRTREKAATPSPWAAADDGLIWTDRLGDPVGGANELDDAEFMAHARQDIPALLAALDAYAPAVDIHGDAVYLNHHGYPVVLPPDATAPEGWVRLYRKDGAS